MNSVALKINGQTYEGWKSVHVTRSLEAVAGAFEVSVSERWDGQSNPWPIEEEDTCILEINGVPLISGFVDTREFSYSAREHSLSVSGRDATGALVDNSAVLKQWEYLNLALIPLANKLCAPFGIKVTLDPTVTRLPAPSDKFTIDPGESSFEVLSRACQLFGVLPVSDGNGGLLITRAGKTRATTSLIEGQNILRATARYECAGRYANYIVTGQKKGTDSDYGLGASSVRGEAQDLTVRRKTRVLMVRPEGQITPALAKQRAQWEAAVRAGRGDTITLAVQDWVQADGTLWPLNALVNVDSRRIGVKGDMLITQIRQTLDEGGTITELTLRDPMAFIPQPSIPSTQDRWKEIAKGV